MSFERTEHQTTQSQQDAINRSLDGTTPPAQIEGYLLQAYLGSGAFGQVWSAVDRTTGKKVAIKFYNRRSVGDIEPLAREVQKLVVLSADRHVVQLLDVGWEADPPYFVMEFLPRGSLEDLLRSQEKIPVHQALDLCEEVAVGLMHLHGKGVLHCDLKPGNVLLDNDGKPRLADFGQSRLSDEATPSLGTLFYMAPEQADLDATPDARWDVYALGALLYVMLTGKPPYFDHTINTEIEASGDIRSRLSAYRKSISAAGPPRRHRSVSGVDRMLAEIIDRCIAIDPRKRYSSVQSALLALRQRSETIARRPLVLLGLVGPLLLFGVIALFGWTAYRQAVNDTDQAITQKAMQSNKFAAQLAARSAAEQMDEYFRAVEQLASDRDFLVDLEKVFANESLNELRLKLSNPAKNMAPDLDSDRQEFRNHSVRTALQFHLRKRMAEQPIGHVDSWWVYDLYGNQLAGVFAESKDPNKPVKITIGLNYSWRTYFSGLEKDLDEAVPGGPHRYHVDPNPEKRQFITRPNLSAVFKSEATGIWKVAFSTPIRKEGKIVGIAGLTVEMGSFVKFDPGANQYAMMYDSRPGAHTGIILEHPILAEQRKIGNRVPTELIECRLDSPPTDGKQFLDPMGNTSLGTAFNQPSIASAAKVAITEYSTDPSGKKIESSHDSGLRIVVLEDYETVIEPAHALGQRLSWLGAMAATFLVIVSLIMWYLVVRLLRGTRQQLSRTFTAWGNTTPITADGAIDVALETRTGNSANPKTSRGSNDTVMEQRDKNKKK